MNIPPLKATPSKTNAHNSSTTTFKAECSNCGSKNRWLLHHVQLRGTDRRLCTSCVLRLHPSSFCPSCFEFFEHPLSTTSSASAHRFLSCIKCSSLTHVQCLPSPPPPPSSFLCPPCSKPNFSFFDIANSDPGLASSGRVLDKKLALVLLCAAKIASASMAKALNLARAKADRSVREAAVARKRAKEALEHFSAVDKAKRVEGSLEVSGSWNFGTKGRDKIQKVPNPGMTVMCKKEDFDGFMGRNKVRSVLPQNGLSVAVQNASKKNGAPDSVVGRDSCFRGNGTAIVKDKSGSDGKLGNREEDLERVQSCHGRIVDVSST